MLFNIIVFFIVLLCLTIILQQSKRWKQDGFVDIPVPGHQEFVKESADKFNQLTNMINLTDPAVPITPSGAKDMKDATGNVILTPSSTSFDILIKSDNPLPEVLPDTLELSKKCESAENTCAAFDDPTFQKYCGMSFDRDAIGSDGKPRSGGGMFVSPTDRSALLTRFKEVKDTGMEPYDPYKVARPTIGQSKPGTFALTKDQCMVVKEKVDCETKQTFQSANCAQCYTSRSFSRVGPEATRIGATLLLTGNGTVSIRSTHKSISMDEKLMTGNSTTEVTLPGDSEGVVLDITVKNAPSPPTFIAGYLQAETARGVFKMDIGRLIQSDKVTNAKPRLSGTKTINGFRCMSMVPGTGKTTMTLSLLIPFSFINMYETDALTCDNGPLITKADSAIFLESDPCFSKDSKPGNYKLECLQDRWVSLGGSQKGTGYPSDLAKANAIQKNGGDLDIDTILDTLGTKMRRAITGKDEAGKALSIAEWNEVSMWGLGIPIESPCDGAENQSGSLTRDCLSYLYMNKGIHSHTGPTYTLPPNESASMKDQSVPNTYCQPGTEMDPATDAGLAFANRIQGGIEGVKKKYDEIHRTANDNTIPNQQRQDAVKKCYGVQLQASTSNKVSGPKQVFAVGPDYRYRRDEAAAVCAKYGAQVATMAQLEDAQKKGADWCFSGWVADNTTGSWPISLNPVNGCGNRRGIIQWTPDSQKAGVNCYGAKPSASDVPTPNEILPFNNNVWDQPAEPTYFKVTGGYLQTTGSQPACFDGLSPQQAMENCDNLGAQCAGFSYSVDGSGSGCYKGNVEGGKVADNNYVGYVKGMPSKTGGTVSGRYIKLQHSRVECMNLAQIRVFSTKGGPNIITPNTVVSKSSVYGGDAFPNRNFVDGVGNTFIHTSCGDVPWILVDLGKTVPLYKIVVQNRADCCKERARGISIQVLDDSKNLIYVSNPITTINDVYTIYPPNSDIQGDVAEDKPVKVECIFDAAKYSAMYPDLQNAFRGDAAKLKQHYINYGMNEGRSPCGLPNCSFNVGTYHSTYPDLQNAFRGDSNRLIQHYKTNGIHEGRVVNTCQK